MKKLVVLYLSLFPFQVAAEEEFSLEAEIELGYGYDSNVSVDDLDLSTNIGDQFADISMSGNVNYKSRKDVRYSASLILSQKLYDTFDQFDGLLALASLSASKEVGDFEFGLTARYIDYQLDDDGFLTITQFSPTVGWFHSKKTYLRFAFERSDESYEQNSLRDNKRDMISASFYYFVNGLRKYIAVKTEIAQKKADASVFDNDAWQIRFSFFNRLNFFSRASTLKLAYLYQERDYAESVNPVIGDFREDQRHRYEIELAMPINEHWSIISKIISNDYESNLASAGYTQQVYQLTARYDF